MAKSAEAFRTISEVADWLEVPAHVLRFWESKFSQVKPVKRAGGRRYYRPNDMLLLGGIKKLLHDDGMTIKGVQKILREQGVKHVVGHSQPLDELTAAEVSEVAGITLDAPPAPDPKPEPTVLSFKRAEPEPESEPEAPAAGTPAGDAPPTLPSFMGRRSDAEPAGDGPAGTLAPEPDPEPAPRPAQIVVPADPQDDIAAPPGVLVALARVSGPISTAMARTLAPAVEKLRARSEMKR